MNAPCIENRDPIFVVGSPRSGTSIFAWCLGQHPNIVNLPETNWLARLGEHVEDLYRLGTINGKYSHLSAIEMPKNAFYAQFGEGIDRLIQVTNCDLVGDVTPSAKSEFRRRRSADDPKVRWIDATPQNSESIYPLSQLFPRARFIHLLRNPHEVARSLRKMSRTGGRNYSMREAYATWLRFTRAARRAEEAFGRERIIRVHYEDLVSDPDRIFQFVLAFLGEPFSEDCKRPLGSKINSSQVDDEALPRPSKLGRQAEAYYQDIRGADVPESPRSTAAYADMESDFLQRCQYVHSPAANIVRHAVAGPLMRWRKKFK